MLAVSVCLGILALWPTACQKRLLTPAEFTQAHVAAWREKHPQVKVEVAKDLLLRSYGPTPTEITETDLRMSYEVYSQEPDRLGGLIERFLRGREQQTQAAAGLDPERIVPLIKKREWLKTKSYSIAHQDLSSDLIIVYGEDFPDVINYPSTQKLVEAGIGPKDLRPLAMKNLLKRIEVRPDSGKGVHMLTAGGDYEASLILADELLQPYQKRIKGSLLIAIPAADLLLMTGSEDSEGLAILKETIARQRRQGTLLSDSFFRYDAGKLTEIREE